MRRVQSGPLVTGAAALAFTGALVGTVSLPRSAFLAGVLCAVSGPLALHLVQRRYAVERLGPADRVTVARGVLASGVLVLAVGDPPVLLLAGLLTLALALDGVDGWVARRTATASTFGARLDMEVDALLILVLSWQVATQVGWWALGLGLARYLFAGLVWLAPALQHQPPPRSWCKTVAVLVAAVLSATAVGLLGPPSDVLLVGAVGVLLAESFAHEGWDRWRAGVLTRRGPWVLEAWRA